MTKICSETHTVNIDKKTLQKKLYRKKLYRKKLYKKALQKSFTKKIPRTYILGIFSFSATENL